jgi:hypothetical protein
LPQTLAHAQNPKCTSPRCGLLCLQVNEFLKLLLHSGVLQEEGHAPQSGVCLCVCGCVYVVAVKPGMTHPSVGCVCVYVHLLALLLPSQEGHTSWSERKRNGNRASAVTDAVPAAVLVWTGGAPVSTSSSNAPMHSLLAATRHQGSVTSSRSIRLRTPITHTSSMQTLKP